MSNKRLISFLTIFVVVGVVFIYAKQGIFLSSDGPDYGVKESEKIKTEAGYGVSASHPLAVEVGMEVLEKGGNAADAAVAVSYMLGVVEPYGSGIGGGGVALIDEGENETPLVYQYREEAPKSGTTPETFPETFAVPGFVKGMEKINSDLGTLPMSELIEPSIQIAEEGFPINNYLAKRFEKGASRMNVPEMPDYFPDGHLLESHDELVQPELASTLKSIQKDGSKAFYEGEIAKDIVEHIDEIELDDLTNFEVGINEPVYGEFAGYEVYSAPPPLAGVTLIQMLQMAEASNIETLDNPVDYIHLFGEITKRAYHDRLTNIGDPDHELSLDSSGLDTEKTTSENYAKQLIDNFNEDKISEYDINDSISDEEDHDNTTHFVIIDENDMMVSATHTLGNFFGSGDFVAGFFLNNQIDNYSLSPTSPNYLESEKVSRSFTSPSILKNEEKTIGIGSPGGKRIPAVMSDVLTRYLMLGDEWEDAIEDSRFYVENDNIYTEDELDKDVQAQLRAKKYEIYNIREADFYGGIQALVHDKKSQELFGTADHRRPGSWQVQEK